MLQQQINYLTLLEQNRHNLADEAIRWANTMLEQLKLEETKRHNLTTEQIQIGELAEKIRHNLVSESQQDQANAINMYLANTRAGELALKEQVEPMKAQAAMDTAYAKAYEASFAGIKAAALEKQAGAAMIKANNDTLRAATSSAGQKDTSTLQGRDVQSNVEYRKRTNDLRRNELIEKSVKDFLDFTNDYRNSKANERNSYRKNKKED